MRIPLTAALAALVAVPLVVVPTQATAAAPAPAANSKPIPTFVMVGFGDSYGSGEGAPAQPGRYAFNPKSGYYEASRKVVWTKGGTVMDERCHRSPNSGLNQAADLLRRTFAGKVNVLFRNFACSGASIRYSVDATFGGVNGSPDSGGILTDYTGMGPDKKSLPVIPPQVEQANDWLAQGQLSQVDAVLVNIGGNDAGFGRMLALCAVNQYLGPLGELAGSDDCAKQVMGEPLPNANASEVIGLLDAPRSYDLGRLGEALAGIGFDAETLTKCTSLTPEEADASLCTPTLEASFRLLAKSLTYPKRPNTVQSPGLVPQTFIRCSRFEEDQANLLFPRAPRGTSVTVPTGATCTRQVIGWTKVVHTYPTLNVAARNVYLNTYPTQPLTMDDGSLCNMQPASDPLTSKVTAMEGRLFMERLVSRLNGVISEAALSANRTDISRKWSVVQVGSARGHGICASASQRWFNLNTDALATMGEEVRVLNFPGRETVSSGWAHPNAKGFLNIYQWPIAEQVRLQICEQFSLTTCPALVGSPGVNADAGLSGRIRGIDGPSIQGASVSLSNEAGEVVAVTSTDSSGNYRFANLIPGTYTVSVTPLSTGPSAFYAPKSSGVSIVALQEATLNLWLDKGGTVAGSVRSAAGAGLEGIRVEAYAVGVNFASDRPLEPVATATSDASGNYRFAYLPPAHLLRFRFVSEPGATPHYRSKWYRNGSTWSTATVVPFEEGDAKTLDPVALQEGPDVGTITGRAVTEQGGAAEGAQVMARTPEGGTVATALVEGDGSFVLEDVPVGTVLVRFGTSPSSDWYSFRESWYPGVLTEDKAIPVEVVADEETALSSEVTLPWGADVSARLTDQVTGEEVDGITVTLLDEQGRSWTGRTVGGRFDFRALAPGRYRVFAEGSGDYLSEWYDEAVDVARATWLTAEEAYSATAWISMQKAPDEVEAQVVRTRAGLKVSWTRGIGGDAYDIQRALGGSRKYTNVVDDFPGFEYLDNSVKAKKAKSACYRIRAVARTGALSPWALACV